MTPSTEVATALPIDPVDAREATFASPLAIEIIDDHRAIEPLWRAFEAAGSATPYQRYDWIAAYIDAFASAGPFAPRIAVVRAPSGAVEMLLPVAVKRRGGLAVAEGIGGRQSNFHLPIIAHAFRRPKEPRAAQALLAALGRALKVDAFAFENMPRCWQGAESPFVLAGVRPSPSNAYAITLSADAEETVGRIGSSESRRKLRKKETALGRLGPVTYRVATSADEVDLILDGFYRQKGERFAELGIHNPFADEAARRFIRGAALAGLDQGLPGIELHGLWLGDQVVATYGGGIDGERFSCMFNSFDGKPELARHSPGDLLLMHVIRAACARGRKVLDLGVGEARYKSAVCDVTEELVDLFYPVSLKGRAYVAAREAAATAKRRIKQTPWAWRMVVSLRAAKARLRG